jgi:ketosteroid isomerase-like protein
VKEVDEFLDAVLPALRRAETAIHNGDAGPRFAQWSHNDPVTLFGALLSGSGWGEIRPVFESLASRFSDCESCEWDVVAAGASGDLGYIVALEHTTASVGGAAPESYELRSTTIFRRENGEWKIVHRHADPPPQSDAARRQLGRINEENSTQ